MRVAVISFPGSNCDRDVLHALRYVLQIDADLVWHKTADLSSYDAAILPGGFSYGDYLRAGVIAAFSPAMKEVRRMAEEGLPMLGICNGFQLLIESGLLPGALLRNLSLKFICRWVYVRVENDRTTFTRIIPRGALLRMPIAHNEGRYFIDGDDLRRLEERGQVVFTYVNERGEASLDANPNGSVANIAGVCNEEGNVLGMMPHPERCSEEILKSSDGLKIFTSIVKGIMAVR